MILSAIFRLSEDRSGERFLIYELVSLIHTPPHLISIHIGLLPKHFAGSMSGSA